ncbi:hypothetical protein EDB85DRAFT_1999099 [Lactarius pseudohatsudake]|nr:hypothetical protein EDB85DRAFT_1999099 [Lactarius pseudohatsudake]
MALGTLTDPPPYPSFDDFLDVPARARLTHLALRHFVGVRSAVHDHYVPPTASPRRSRQWPRPCDCARSWPSGAPRSAAHCEHAVRWPALFGTLGGALKEFGLDVDVRPRGRLLGAQGNSGTGLKVLELSLEGTSRRVLSLAANGGQAGRLAVA